MTDAIRQADRLLQVKTPLGEDVLLLEHFSGSENVSGLFSFDLDLLADMELGKDKQVVPENIIGKGVSVLLDAPDGAKFFHGLVRRFVRGHQDERFAHYRAEVVPWLWLLTLKANCRIFQKESVVDIITKVLNEAGGDFRVSTKGSYTKWDYCVQYRETDFNFVSRLMEQEGLFYFFEHEQGKHTLVITDDNGTFPPCPGKSKVRLEAQVGFDEREDAVTDFQMSQELRTGKYRLRDYHFEVPTKTLEKTEPARTELGGNSKFETYDYPGEYALRFNEADKSSGAESEGEKSVRLRMEEEEVPQSLGHGSSTCRQFHSGYAFELQTASDTKKYVLLSVQHSASQSPSYVSEESSSYLYQNSFVCIPKEISYRAPRLTPKPVVHGPQTAVVVGPAGEEIHVDKYGRVKVQFFWDREGKKNEKSSCWIRVAQPWAGGDWGSVWIPRIGQEVIVGFLEGDPDQPIITGRVYNADRMPPYKLPDHQTVSAFKSRSSKGGGTDNFNELRFEDKKGAEQVFINAERDMDHRVEHDSREFIGANRHLIVSASQMEQVGGDKHGHVSGKHQEKIDGDMSLQVGGKQLEKTTGEKSVETDGDHMEKIGGTASLKISGDLREDIGGGLSVTVGQSHNQKVGQTLAVEAGQTIHIKGGMTVIIEAGMQLSLKGPGGFIDIGPSGVSIQGTMVLINSGGAAGSGPGASPQSPDAPTAPVDPESPDKADDGSKFTKL